MLIEQTNNLDVTDLFKIISHLLITTNYITMTVKFIFQLRCQMILTFKLRYPKLFLICIEDICSSHVTVFSTQVIIILSKSYIFSIFFGLAQSCCLSSYRLEKSIPCCLSQYCLEKSIPFLGISFFSHFYPPFYFSASLCS